MADKNADVRVEASRGDVRSSSIHRTELGIVLADHH
ncbi:hypothetical protein QE435_002091 [Rhizobium sp. SORGH_AS 787]|nr:hypothetical protein [Rhizobium sp. SORGH_AS_0787]